MHRIEQRGCPSSLWLYYIGLDDPHTGNREALKRWTLSRVVLRKDGCTCVEADYAGGGFTTPLLKFDGDELRLNIETSAIGLARVEIQGEDGRPIEGFARQDCGRIHRATSTDHRVTWQGRGDVGALRGRPVRLRFELQYGTKLYAFRFAAEAREACSYLEVMGPDDRQHPAQRVALAGGGSATGCDLCLGAGAV